MNKLIIYIVAIGIIIGGWYSYHIKVINLTKENTTLVNNNKAYGLELIGLQDSLKISESSRISYKLTIEELRKSNDLVTRELRKVATTLKIAEKELVELRHFKSTVRTDTTIKIIKSDSCEFEATIKYNDQTIFDIRSTRINGKDSLKHKALISASFSEIVYKESEWKEPNFFKRLFLFKWGKYHYEKNELVSDNDMIQIKDFKVIKIIE